MDQFSFLFVFSILAGCGAQDAINATKKMPEKMDGTYAQIVKTNQEMGKTTDAIHKQILLLSLQDMLRPENSKYLLPPTGMLAGGETFSKEATAEEMVKLAYVWLQEVIKAQPADLATLGEKGLAYLLHEKMVKLTALQVIAGLAPQSTIESLVKEQILEGGRYEAAAYSVLMSRALFIKSFLLDESLMSGSEKLDNLGKLEEAIERTSQLDYLTRLQFASKICLEIKVSSVDLNISESLDKLDPSMGLRFPLIYWKKINESFNTSLNSEHTNSVKARQRKEAIAQKINAYLKSWQLP
ncbi:MAG: hypothetical protein IPK68_23365 [Bdellovibrionales bacterium]|nr:hypothetical protein [Bdellovibrionales bacterium]